MSYHKQVKNGRWKHTDLKRFPIQIASSLCESLADGVDKLRQIWESNFANMAALIYLYVLMLSWLLYYVCKLGLDLPGMSQVAITMVSSISVHKKWSSKSNVF